VPHRARIEEGRAHAQLAQGLDLVLHQRDQGETTIAVPSRSSAGTWLQGDLPPPVA
jgi:hypothetical protein